MRCIIGTETGSIYEVTDTHLTRMKQGDRSNALRRDGEPLMIVTSVGLPVIGRSYVALLEGLGELPNTVRRTSAVRWIRWLS